MFNRRKIRGCALLFLIISITLATFAACNSEIADTKAGLASVNFVPSTSKALNQSGIANDTTSESVDMYHWKFKVAETYSGLSSVEYSEFIDKSSEETGLGTIQGLLRGKSYWFSIRGYEPGTDNLVWEGTTDRAFELNSKKAVVTIQLYPMGSGNVYFDLTAPVYNHFEIYSSGSDYCLDYPEHFQASWSLLSDANTSGTNVLGGVFDSKEGDSISFTSEEPLKLRSGSYLFTVSQCAYDFAEEDTLPVKERTQVLIVTVEPGVRTYVTGSLDSSALNIIDYQADMGMDVLFYQTSGADIKNLDVKATVDDEECTVLSNQRLAVENGKYAKLTFTTKTDTDDPLKLYVNRNRLDLTSTTDLGYVVDVQGNETNIKLASENEIHAYKTTDTDYIITVRYDREAMAFTITDSV